MSSSVSTIRQQINQQQINQQQINQQQINQQQINQQQINQQGATMLKTQVQVLGSWNRIRESALATPIDRQARDRGEVTAQTAMIALLVIAAIAAGGIIANKITGNANKIPSP